MAATEPSESKGAEGSDLGRWVVHKSGGKTLVWEGGRRRGQLVTFLTAAASAATALCQL